MTDGIWLNVACHGLHNAQSHCPAARLTDGGRCGKCGNSCFRGSQSDQTRVNFEKHATSGRHSAPDRFRERMVQAMPPDGPGLYGGGNRSRPHRSLKPGRYRSRADIVGHALCRSEHSRSRPCQRKERHSIARTTRRPRIREPLLQWIEDALALYSDISRADRSQAGLEPADGNRDKLA